MHQFKDLGITTEIKGFTGEKIKMSRVLNKEITVFYFDIKPSKYPEKGNGKCLYLQIEMNNTKFIVFTGSTVLQEMILKVPQEKLPFITTIIEENERFQFT